MSRVNKVQSLKQGLGISKGQILAGGPDNVPAMIHSQSGTPQEPAMIKEGEIVFSVESVIGAGGGDYDKGAKILLELHNRLRQMGMKALQSQGSLASVGEMDDNYAG